MFNFADICTCNQDIRWTAGDGTVYPVPLFTNCAFPDCQYTFPFPNYNSVRQTFERSSQWDHFFYKMNRRYPRHSKIAKAVWRGSLTGTSDLSQNVRYQLCKMSLNHSDILDVRTNQVDDGKDPVVHQQVSEIRGDYIGFRDFQKYRAIIDVDGNAWSSRFGLLLCLNSVVLKVQPETVDYFHPTLQPWRHFIPVHKNLSNVLDQVHYVLNKEHSAQIQSIVDTANQWCRDNVVLDTLARDALDIWNFYAEKLHQADSHWSVKWKQKKLNMKAFQEFEQVRHSLFIERAEKKINFARLRYFEAMR